MGSKGVYANCERLNSGAQKVSNTHDYIQSAHKAISTKDCSENIFGSFPIAQNFHQQLKDAHYKYRDMLAHHINGLETLYNNLINTAQELSQQDINNAASISKDC